MFTKTISFQKATWLLYWHIDNNCHDRNIEDGS